MLNGLYTLDEESVRKAIENLEGSIEAAIAGIREETGRGWARDAHGYATDIVEATARLRRYRYMVAQVEEGADILDALAIAYTEAEREALWYRGGNSTSGDANRRDNVEHQEALRFLEMVRNGLVCEGAYISLSDVLDAQAHVHAREDAAKAERKAAEAAEHVAEWGLPEKDGRKVTHQGLRADLRKHGIAVASSDQWRGVHVEAAERRFPAVIIEADTGYWVERKNWSDPGVAEWDDERVQAFRDDVADVLAALDDLGYQYRIDTHAAALPEGEDVETEMMHRGCYAVAVTGWKVDDES